MVEESPEASGTVDMVLHTGDSAARVAEIVSAARAHDFSALGRGAGEVAEEQPVFDGKGTSLAGCDFSGITFYNGMRGANFSRCDCRKASFSGCNLTEANFSNADLRGADLRGATLGNARLDGAHFDETTKGLEQCASGCANFRSLDDQAKECGATVRGMLIVLGHAPSTEELDELKRELQEYTRPIITSSSYAQSIHKGERANKILPQWKDRPPYDAFDHSPSDSMEDYFTPPITKTTPPDELYQTSSGLSLFWGVHGIKEDTPGRSLNESNTRHLAPIARSVIAVYEKDHDCTVLDMGAGAGVSAGDLSEMKGVTVDTVALSPTSPTIRLRMSWSEIYEKIGPAFHHEGQPWEHWERILMLRGIDDAVIAGVRRLYYCTKKDTGMLLKPEFPLKTRVALGLDALFPRLNIFQNTVTPYIRHQYIGEFPAHTNIPTDTYDVIQDDNGPLWHMSRISVEGKTQPSMSIGSLVHLLAQSLHDDGCLVCRRIEPNPTNLKSLETIGSILRQDPSRKQHFSIQEYELGMRDALRWDMHKDPDHSQTLSTWPFDDGDILLLGTGENPPFVFAKAKSRIAQDLSRSLGIEPGKGGFHRVEDLEEKIRRVSKHR